MTMKRVRDRRKKNRALAVEDAKHRCAHCKIALPKTGVHLLVGDRRQWCSAQCMNAALEVGTETLFEIRFSR